MLKNKRIFRNIVLVGANSEIGNAILNEVQISNDAHLTLIGRGTLAENNVHERFKKVSFFQNDLSESVEIHNLELEMSSYRNADLVIVASGVLPNENEDLNLDSVENTLLTNTLGICSVLSISAKLLLRVPHSHLLYISSVASVRPRTKNFTYGASKVSADFFAIGLGAKYKKENLHVTVIRPGYVYTKMSKTFTPAPFSLPSERVAQIAVRAINRRQNIVYAPRKLLVVMNILRLLPRSIFDRLG